MSMGLLVANGEPLVDMQRCLANSSRERRSVRVGKLILTSAHLFPRPLFMDTARGNVTPAAAETLSIHSHIQTPRWTSSQTLNPGNSADTLSSRDLPVYHWSCQHLIKLMRLDVYWLVLGNPMHTCLFGVTVTLLCSDRPIYGPGLWSFSDYLWRYVELAILRLFNLPPRDVPKKTQKKPNIEIVIWICMDRLFQQASIRLAAIVGVTRFQLQHRLHHIAVLIFL